MERLIPSARPMDAKQIDRVQSPWRRRSTHYISIIIGSMLPFLFLADVMPIVPPLGFMMLIAWRMLHPGLLPLWIGVPLGLVDDLFSGQPFGSAILLWSITMIALEILEAKFPWRGFWQDWFAASSAIAVYTLIAMLVSGATPSIHLMIAGFPQIVMAVLLYPILSRIVAGLERFRLRRARRV